MESLSHYETLKVFKQSIKYIYDYDKKYPFLMVLKSLIEGFVPPITLLFMQEALNRIQTKETDFFSIVILLNVYFSLKIAASVISSIFILYSARFQKLFSNDLDIKILKIIARMNIDDFEDSETYDVIRRTQTQKGDRLILFLNECLDILSEIISSIGMILILIKFNVLLVFFVILFPILQYFFAVQIGKEQYELFIKRTTDERKIWYLDYLFTSGNAFKELKLFNFSDLLINRYRYSSKAIIKQDLDITGKYTKTTCFFSTIDAIVSLLTYIYIGYKTFTSKILLGDMTTYVNSIDSIKTSVSTCMQSAGSITQNSYYVRLIFDFLDREKNIEPDLRKDIIIKHLKSIEFVNVSYKYNGSTEYTLKNISFILEPGDVLGIVGKNGSGKSTILNLIMGFYKNYEGKIMVNSIDLNLIDVDSYQKLVSAVFQDFVKYEFSVQDNIVVSDIEKNTSKDRICELLDLVSLNKNCFNNNLETVIGKWFGETEMSSGEWQKIAISRGLYRNSDLLILDEPDASLDSIAEQELVDLISQTFEEKMGVYVSHKVSHIGGIASKIIVLDKGRIVERGDSESLLDIKGFYFRLYNNC